MVVLDVWHFEAKFLVRTGQILGVIDLEYYSFVFYHPISLLVSHCFLVVSLLDILL